MCCDRFCVCAVMVVGGVDGVGCLEVAGVYIVMVVGGVGIGALVVVCWLLLMYVDDACVVGDAVVGGVVSMTVVVVALGLL